MIFQTTLKGNIGFTKLSFQVTMKILVSNGMVKCRHENQMIKLWHLVVCLFKFMRFVELAIFHILGNMEDEKIFSILSLMKSKLWNQLSRPLNITICIFVKKNFTNELFLSNMLLQIGMMEIRQRLEWMHEQLAWS
jgi:hypothetical protein